MVTRGRQVWVGVGICLGVLALLTQVAAAQSFARRNQGPEVRRLGLSRVGENTLLTLVLDRKAEPKSLHPHRLGKTSTGGGISPGPAGRVPTRLEGDDFLVEQVVTETAASPAAGCASSWTSFRTSPTFTGGRAGPARGVRPSSWWG